MKTKIRHLWQEHRLLLVTFLIVSVFTTMFLLRSVIGAVYFRNHPDQPIKPWMPIGFIAKTYQVPPDILLDAAGIPESVSIRLRIRRVAEETGVPYDELVDHFLDAIRDHRGESPRP